MAAEQQAIADVMNLLEAEPNAGDGGVVESGPDIPTMREQLAVLVSTSKAKEAIGVVLVHEDVKRLTDKDVEKYSKRYETYVGSKTTESLIGSTIDAYAYAAASMLNIHDIGRLKEDLKKDFTISKELTIVAGKLALKFGRFLAVANTALITMKHVTFTQQSTSNPEQSSSKPEQSSAIAENKSV